MTDDELEVENQAHRRGKLTGLSGDDLYDRLHPKPGTAKESAADLLRDLRKQAREKAKD